MPSYVCVCWGNLPRLQSYSSIARDADEVRLVVWLITRLIAAPYPRIYSR